MAYSITTKDGITIDNIPDDVPPDAQSLKDRVAAIRAGGGVAQEEPGFIAGLIESVTGAKRATPETQALPEWTGMPELNQLSMASFKTALGTLLSNPKETVQILQSNFPGVQVRQDAKGNFLLRSSIDKKEYAIPPGFSMGDIPRAAGGIAAFTPAGRAATIPGAIAASGATQAAIEASQSATGGEFGVGDVALSAALGPAGQIAQRTIPPVVSAVKRVATKARPSPVPDVPPITTPGAAQPAQLGDNLTQFADQAVPPASMTDEAVGDLVKRASGTGFRSDSAKQRLAEAAQVNLAAREAAERLGIDLPADVFSDNPQVRAAAGLTRSAAGSEAEAAWRNTVSSAVDQADSVIGQFDVAFVDGTVAPGVVSQRIKNSLISAREGLNAQATKMYDDVNNAVPKTTVVELPKLADTLAVVKREVGEAGMSTAERNLLKMIESGEATYGRLLREKALIGKAIGKMESPYGNMAEADLKRLYAALADDQLTHVGNIGGEGLRQQLRAANLLYAKGSALGNRIINAFGNDIEGSVANKMRTAITGAAKGDAGEFNRLLKTVPEDLRKETVATALASVTRSARGAERGGFGFSEFADIYPKLRANPPVYKTIVDTLGKDSADVLRDLFVVSKRITEARANVLTTGKANQALLQGLQAESLIGKIMESTISKGVVTGVAATTGPITAGAAAVTMNALTQGNKDSLKAAGKLFADDSFQRMAVEAAKNGTPSAGSLRRVAASQAFDRFATAAKLPKSLDARLQWMQSALQTSQQLDQENQ